MSKDIQKINFEIDRIEEPQVSMRLKTSSKKKIDSKNLRVLSLFSGCGGMDLGFEGGFKVHKDSINLDISSDFVDDFFEDGFAKLKKNRFTTIFANDILDSARNTWIKNFKGMKIDPEVFYSESIVDLVKLEESGETIFPNKVDVVTGGFPCQDFSIAGKRRGFKSEKNHLGDFKRDHEASEETRGKLYMWMKKVVEITQPKVFIAENVKGLVNLSNVKEIIQKDFSSISDNGYFVFEPKVLHAADYGVPQTRERVFFIGLRKSALKEGVLEKLMNDPDNLSLSPYPDPTHNYTVNNSNLKSPVKVGKIFRSLNEPEISDDLSQKYYSKAKFMGKHCQGQTEVNLDGLSPTIRAEHHGNIEFRRLSLENGGIQESEFEAGLKERRLTLRECGLIQTFPPDFEFVIKSDKGRRKFLVSPSAAYKVIGNAVPPLLAYHVAKKLEKNWNKYFID